MSLILKGIDMPKECKGIELVFIPKDGDIIYNSESMSIGADRIIEIPTPHGRLIDADKLCNEFSNRCPGDCGCCGESDDIYDCRLIINAPTILEAEE